MNNLGQRLQVGDLLVFEQGLYSDRKTSNPARVIKSFVKCDAVNEFRAQWKPHPSYEGEEEEFWDQDPDPDEFESWLYTAGYIEPVYRCTTWYIGAYGCFEP